MCSVPFFFSVFDVHLLRELERTVERLCRAKSSPAQSVMVFHGVMEAKSAGMQTQRDLIEVCVRLSVTQVVFS